VPSIAGRFILPAAAPIVSVADPIELPTPLRAPETRLPFCEPLARERLCGDLRGRLERARDPVGRPPPELLRAGVVLLRVDGLRLRALADRRLRFVVVWAMLPFLPLVGGAPLPRGISTAYPRLPGLNR
jgi:hypothetical protein